MLDLHVAKPRGLQALPHGCRRLVCGFSQQYRLFCKSSTQERLAGSCWPHHCNFQQRLGHGRDNFLAYNFYECGYLLV